MALVTTHTFEDGTSGATPVVGPQFVQVIGSVTYGPGLHGALGLKAVNGGYVSVAAPVNNHSGSQYVRLTSLTAGSARIWTFTDASNVFVAQVRMHASGIFDIADTSTTRVVAGTQPWALGQLYRVDYQISGTGTTRALTVRIYKDESTTPYETLTAPAVTSGTSNPITRVRFGGQGATTSELTVDTVRLYDALEWPAPYVTTVAYTGSIALGATGTLVAAGRPATAGTLPSSATGTLLLSGRASFHGSLPLTASGSLSLSGAPALTGSVDLSGEGQALDTGSPELVGTIGFDGSGSTVLAGRPAVQSDLGLAGTGTLRVMGDGALPPEDHSGLLELNADGTLSVAGTPAAHGLLAASGPGNLTTIAVPAFTSWLDLSSSGVLERMGTAAIVAALDLSNLGTINLGEHGAVDIIVVGSVEDDRFSGLIEPDRFAGSIEPSEFTASVEDDRTTGVIE